MILTNISSNKSLYSENIININNKLTYPRKKIGKKLSAWRGQWSNAPNFPRNPRRDSSFGGQIVIITIKETSRFST